MFVFVFNADCAMGDVKTRPKIYPSDVDDDVDNDAGGREKEVGGVKVAGSRPRLPSLTH